MLTQKFEKAECITNMACLMTKCDTNEYNYGLYHGIRKKFVIWNERNRYHIKK